MADPNFNIGPKPIDIGSLIEMARGAQRLQGESSLGGIIGQATRPDGTMDTGMLGRLAPQAGVMAPEVAQRAQSMQQGQQVIDRTKLDNLREWYKTLDQTVYPLVNDPELNHGKVLDAIHGLVGHKASMLNGGLFTPDMAIKTAQQFYGPQGKPLPPEQIRKTLGQFHTRVLGALEASESVPIGVDSEGRALHMTRAGAIARDAAQPRGPGGAAQPGAPGGAPPSVPMRPGMAVQPGGGVATPSSMPAGFEERAKGSGGLVARDYEDAANYRRQVMPLEQAIPALAKLGKTGTGPGTDEFNKIKSFLQSAGAGQMLGIDPEKIKNFDEAKKYLTDWVMATGATGTNDKLAAAFASNASVGISNAAAIDVAKTALSVRRMKHAQAAEFAQTGLPDGEYSRWALKWNAAQDPRAYGFDLMTREAAGKFLKGLSPEDRKRFEASLVVAERNQLTSPRGGWNAE